MLWKGSVSVTSVYVRAHTVFPPIYPNNPFICLLIATGDLKRGRTGPSAILVCHPSVLNCSEIKLDLWVFCTQPHLPSADATLWGVPVLQEEKISRSRHVWTASDEFLWWRSVWNNCVVSYPCLLGCFVCAFFSFFPVVKHWTLQCGCMSFLKIFFPLWRTLKKLRCFLVALFFSRTHLL